MLNEEKTLRPSQPNLKQAEQREFSSPVCYADSMEVREEFRDEGTLKPKLLSPNIKPKDKPNEKFENH